MADVMELIGRGYAEGGDGPEAFDCYGLLRYARRHYFELATPLGGSVGTREREPGRESVRALKRAAASGEWERVVEPGDPGDCVLLGRSLARPPTHVGLALPGGVLHAFRGDTGLGGSVVLTPWPRLGLLFHRVEVWQCSRPCC